MGASRVTDKVKKVDEAEQWISVEERDPKDGEEVWVYNEQIGVKEGVYLADGTGNVWAPDGSLITHWQPRILEPPA